MSRNILFVLVFLSAAVFGQALPPERFLFTNVNVFDGKIGVIEAGAYADILLVDGNPLEDISVIGGNELWLKAPKPTPIETIRMIMKDGVIYKNTL